MVIILMGVSGCGKTHIGQLLAEETGLPFFDGDDFHPPANVQKMKNGHPLNDEDRLPWLRALARHISQWDQNGGAILACSALKQIYRDLLADQAPDQVLFVHLKGPKELITRRLEQRDRHFMPPELLDSQLEALEEPEQAIVVSIDQTPEEIVGQIVYHLQSDGE